MVSPHHRSKIGNEAERLAANFLLQQGYTIFYKNYRIRGGEIDLIGMEQDTLCFIEVRSRQNQQFGQAIETISLRKKTFLTRTAEHFLANVWNQPACPCRFDVIALEGTKPEIVLIRNAF